MRPPLFVILWKRGTETRHYTNRDGTTGTGTYSWPCPEVTPNARHLLLSYVPSPLSTAYSHSCNCVPLGNSDTIGSSTEFTNNGLNPTWTTRFTIAAADGSSVSFHFLFSHSLRPKLPAKSPHTVRRNLRMPLNPQRGMLFHGELVD